MGQQKQKIDIIYNIKTHTDKSQTYQHDTLKTDTKQRQYQHEHKIQTTLKRSREKTRSTHNRNISTTQVEYSV